MNRLDHTFHSTIKQIFEYIRHIAESLPYPGRCYSCEKEWHQKRELLCGNCWDELQKAPQNLVLKYVNINAPVVILYQYTTLLRNIIHQMKFLGRKDIAKSLGYYSGLLFKRIMIGSNFDAVAPVPLHPTRIRERGFDQNLVIANSFSERVGIKVEPNLIIRLKHTPHQSRLSEAERSTNLINAFGPNLEYHSEIPKSILLLDDVIHSGATVSGCIDALKKMNVNNITVVSVCG